MDPSFDWEKQVQLENVTLDIDMIDTKSTASGPKDAHSELFKMLCSLFMLCNHTRIINGEWGNTRITEKELHGSINLALKTPTQIQLLLKDGFHLCGLNFELCLG